MTRTFRVVMGSIAAALVLAIQVMGCQAQPAGQKPLDRQTALKLLGYMGYSNVQIGAIVNGVASLTSRPPSLGFGSSSAATVYAAGIQGGVALRIEETFLYDSSEGWVYIQFLPGAGRVAALAMWTEKGYRLIEPVK